MKSTLLLCASPEYSAASAETQSKTHKYHNIFSIKLNASNAFTK